MQKKKILSNTPKAIGVNAMNCGCEVTKNLLDSKKEEKLKICLLIYLKR